MARRRCEFRHQLHLRNRHVVTDFVGGGMVGGGEKNRAIDLCTQVVGSLSAKAVGKPNGLLVGKLAVEQAESLGGHGRRISARGK